MIKVAEVGAKKEVPIENLAKIPIIGKKTEQILLHIICSKTFQINRKRQTLIFRFPQMVPMKLTLEMSGNITH